MLIILSHGNAVVESGFSINESLLVENLHDQSLIAQRIVTDAIKAAGGVRRVDIDKEMIRHVRNSSSRYKQALEDRRQLETEESARAATRKRKAQEISRLEKELDGIERIDNETRKKRAAIEAQIASLKM